MRTIAFLLAALTLEAQPPKDVLDLFRDMAEALSANEPGDFLDHFDRKMPGYAMLRDEVRALLDQSEVGSSIEIVTDEGNDRQRTLQLDWLLQIDRESPRRQIVKCRIERQGRRWKIVSLDPIEFFKKSAP